MRGPRRMRGAHITKTSLARQLRRDSTRAERKLWRYLRSRSLAGFKFVRQEPIGPYVVDFVCRERRLVIEVGGGQHADNRRDAVRDQWLADHRYRVLRFWNNEVLGNIEGVWDTIFAAASVAAPPHPNPLPASGRGSRHAAPPDENSLQRMQRLPLHHAPRLSRAKAHSLIFISFITKHGGMKPASNIGASICSGAPGGCRH